MSEGKVTVRALKFFLDSGSGKHVSPETSPFQVDRARAAELKANGLVEIMGERKAAAGERLVPQVRMLQHGDGRPNDEPKPDTSAGFVSPTPGDGVGPALEFEPPVDPGTTNPEPKPGSAAPAPGTGDFAAPGPQMVVENPESLVPATEGIIERRVATPAPAPHHRPAPAAATPVTESTSVAKETRAPKATSKVKDR